MNGTVKWFDSKRVMGLSMEMMAKSILFIGVN